MEIPASKASIIESVKITRRQSLCEQEYFYTVTWVDPGGATGYLQVPYCHSPKCLKIFGWAGILPGDPGVLLSAQIPTQDPVATVYLLVWPNTDQDRVEARVVVDARNTNLVESGPGIYPVPIEDQPSLAQVYGDQLDDVFEVWKDVL